MSSALVALVAVATLAGDLEVDLGLRMLVSGGLVPLDAQSDPITQVALEVSPRGGLLWDDGATSVTLLYSPRITQRFVLALDAAGEALPIDAPISFHPVDLGVEWRSGRRYSLRLGASAAYGVVSFADAITAGANNGAVSNQEVANFGGRAALAVMTVPRGDMLRLSLDVANNTTLGDRAAGASIQDRTRFSGGVSYVFAPTPRDGLEIAVNGETSLYPDTDASTPNDQASVLGANVGWERQLTRRASCGVRLGAVMLFNAGVGSVVPSASTNCSILTYQSPGYTLTTRLNAGLLGGTSSLGAVAEPRGTGALDLRLLIEPDKSLGLAVAFEAPIPTDDTVGGAAQTTVGLASPAILAFSVPFTWQLAPGMDLELGGRFALRGILDVAGVVNANATPVRAFGDTFDLQLFAGMAFDFASSGESRYQR